MQRYRSCGPTLFKQPMAIFKQERLARIESDLAQRVFRHTVMIVDDKDSNVSVMAAILRPYFHLIEANDGQEALALIDDMADTGMLACVISDHRMPKMTGVDLFEQVLPRLPQARRILVTGYLDLDAIVDAINKGEIYRFIAKPFDAAEFLLTVRIAVASFESQRQLAQFHQELEAQWSDRSGKAAELLAGVRQANEEMATLDAELRALRGTGQDRPG